MKAPIAILCVVLFIGFIAGRFEEPDVVYDATGLEFPDTSGVWVVNIPEELKIGNTITMHDGQLMIVTGVYNDIVFVEDYEISQDN